MNIRMTWRDVRGLLRANRAAAAKPRPAQAFWDEFQARVAMYPQHVLAPRPAGYRAYGWIAAGGALAASAVVASVYLLGGNGNGMTADGGSVVRSYRVGVKHSAVVLLTQQSAQATILWVAGMESSGKEEL